MIGDQILENFVSTVAEEHDQTIVLYGLPTCARAGRRRKPIVCPTKLHL
jgi:hypothetical protein